MLTCKGVNVWVVNACHDDDIACHIYIPSHFPRGTLLIPWISIFCSTDTMHDSLHTSDFCALPTWLQLVCKPHEFVLPGMNHYADLIPVMMAVTVRTAMNRMLACDNNDCDAKLTIMLLAEEFDQKYSRFNTNSHTALDSLLRQMDSTGDATEEHVSYCMTLGYCLISLFFNHQAYSPSDLWQSAINNQTESANILLFHSNMSDVRSKITTWLCQIENELRRNGPYTERITTHAKDFLKHTYNIFKHYDSISLLHTRQKMIPTFGNESLEQELRDRLIQELCMGLSSLNSSSSSSSLNSSSSSNSSPNECK